MHQIECNMFFKGHIERVRMDIYNLEKTGDIGYAMVSCP